MTTIRPAGLLGVLALVAGCDFEPGIEPGELHNGTFSYECAGATDAWCETNFRHGGRPLLGVGAPFRVRYSDIDVGSVQIAPVSPARVSLSRGRFAFVAPGPCAFLAEDVSGMVRDFYHLQAADIADLELVRADGRLSGTPPGQQLTADPWALDPLATLPLTAGSRATVFGYPVAFDREVLAGSAVWDFVAEPAGVVELQQVPGDNVVTIEAVAAGSAVVRASAAGITRTLHVHVEVGP